MRTLAIDLGARRIGLALSDAGGKLATPYDVIHVTHPDQAIYPILQLIDREEVRRLVVGLPLNMDGSDGPSAQSARAFGRNWVNHSPLPLVFQDERLSTSAVTRTLIEADSSRKRRSEVVDKMAAAYILQIALDRLRSAQ